MKKNQKGTTVGSLIVAVAVLAMGIGTVGVMVRSDVAQKQHLAAQTQRATFTTFQAEVAAQGIDPSGILNPMSSIATPNTSQNPQSNPNINMSMGAMSVAETTISSGSGGADMGGVNVTSPFGTGNRGGSHGTTIITDGTDTSHLGTSYTLQAPSLGLGSTQLSYANFPATGWFILPSNPPGTIYRFTTDGGDPSASSPVWNLANAVAITPSNFPQTIKIRAFHSDSDYTSSATTTVSGLTYLLESPTNGRFTAPSNGANQFTYAEQVGPSFNGITLAAPLSAAGLPTTIYYTTDGSDPVSSPTRQTYSAAFLIPLASWTWGGGLGVPATGTVRTVLIGGSSKYVNSAVATYTYTNVPQTLAVPTISVASGTYPVNTPVTFSHPMGAVIAMRYDRLTDPTESSPAGTAVVLQ